MRPTPPPPPYWSSFEQRRDEQNIKDILKQLHIDLPKVYHYDNRLRKPSQLYLGLYDGTTFTPTPTPRRRPNHDDALVISRGHMSINGLPFESFPEFKIHEENFLAPRKSNSVSVADVASVHPHTHSNHWGTAALGWVAGTLVLALLVLLVRATEKCIDKRFKSRSRQSDEWEAPDVLATRDPRPDDIIVDVGPGNLDNLFINTRGGQGSGEHGNNSVDLPPPYSECTNNSTSSNSNDLLKSSILGEDPPPPYSDCYVSLTKANDGIPSVHIVTRRPSEGRSGDNNDVTLLIAVGDDNNNENELNGANVVVTTNSTQQNNIDNDRAGDEQNQQRDGHVNV